MSADTPTTRSHPRTMYGVSAAWPKSPEYAAAFNAPDYHMIYDEREPSPWRHLLLYAVSLVAGIALSVIWPWGWAATPPAAELIPGIGATYTMDGKPLCVVILSTHTNSDKQPLARVVGGFSPRFNLDVPRNNLRTGCTRSVAVLAAIAP